MSTPERAEKNKIRKLLDEYDSKVWWFMPSNNGYGKAGVPDFIICANGRFIAVEAKAGKGVPTPLQLQQMQEIHDANGLVVVVGGAFDNLAILKTWIDLALTT